ncbi:hypothetical protein LPJ69_004302 [Coemansia sp. RSA 1752]|nr:hypothetical protein LPJ69_004302 [Coemansia sp. RSA 1752]
MASTYTAEEPLNWMSKLNLLSVSRLTKNNAQVLFDAHGTYVYRDGKPILYAPAVNGLYPVTAASLSDP